MKIVKETRIKFEKGVPLRLEGNDRDYLASWYPFFSFLVQYRSTGWRRRTEQQRHKQRKTKQRKKAQQQQQQQQQQQRDKTR